MNRKILRFPGLPYPANVTPKRLEPSILFCVLLLAWYFGPEGLHYVNETAGSIDQSIWLLILLSIITFLLFSALCWWLLKQLWLSLGLPALDQMVLQFNTLTLWQQLIFYWASFALLLLAASLCLTAIC